MKSRSTFDSGNGSRSYYETLEDFWPHLWLFGRNFANLGRGGLLTDRLANESAPALWYALGPQHDGFLEAGRPEMSAAERAHYEAELTRRRTRPLSLSSGQEVTRETLLGLLKQWEDRGAETGLILTPVVSLHKFHLLPGQERQHLVFDYSDVDRYPELYVPEHRLDEGHLNTAGAHLFTRILAEEYCAAARRRP